MIFLKLFLTFFKIGVFTFGGGYAMLPFIQTEVLANKWLTQEELINFIAVSESTPGPFAINISTYVGMESVSQQFNILGGLFGAFCATLGVVLPSFLIILIVASFFTRFQNNSIVKGCMSGLKPAVVGMICSVIFSTGLAVFFPNGINLSDIFSIDFIINLIIFLLAFFLIMKKKHPIIVIGISALLGMAVGYLQEII